MVQLTEIAQGSDVSLYELTHDQPAVRCFVASTPQSRTITNDPFLLGCAYTDALQESCGAVLSLLHQQQLFASDESRTLVLNVLRGGLNFGLRGALAKTFGWNLHSSSFLSAQRSRMAANSEQWEITETTYRKVFLPKGATFVLGEVVATGTSLEYALEQLYQECSSQQVQPRELVLFTIGGPQAAQLVAKFSERCKNEFPEFRGAQVIFLEGRFSLTRSETPVSVKHTGTDLLRRDAVLAPEFIESQFECPAYPLERCAIYDAGSRAYWIPEYLKDVADYWQKTAELAAHGMSFEALAAERFPELAVERFGGPSLTKIASRQLERAWELLSRFPGE